MDFNLKDYQIFKFKKYLKKKDFFFLFHSAKLDSVKWTNTEQKLKKLNLKYYKPLNKTVLKAFKNSTYKNFNSSIGGFLLFVQPNNSDDQLNLPLINKNLHPSFVLIGIKLNTKIYSTSQLKGVNSLSYKKNMFNLHRTIDRYLKTTYILTNKKKVSK